jgi:hypothetical protein
MTDGTPPDAKVKLVWEGANVVDLSSSWPSVKDTNVGLYDRESENENERYFLVF